RHGVHDWQLVFVVHESLSLVRFCLFRALPRPPISSLFPYTTLFRSNGRAAHQIRVKSDRGAPLEHVEPLRLDLMRAVRVQVGHLDRKSTRLNSSHGSISYAVLCLIKQMFYSYSSSTVG